MSAEPSTKPSAKTTPIKFVIGDKVECAYTPNTGTVTWVGRKYLTVEYDGIAHTWQASLTRKVEAL